MKHNLRIFKIFILAEMFLFSTFSLFARNVEILVEDIDLGLPLEGAVVRSWDGREYICDKYGTVLVFVPDDRQVVIQATYPGYENSKLIIVADKNKYTLSLHLSGIMESQELVVEATIPGTNETQTGRSIAISGRDIAQTAEIGIVEDVMSSINLLPGVGYTGFLDSQPSIRGGDPGDLRASLDGFYIFYPYHLRGSFSIFNPRMVQSAQLSHGVFSSRYGHTNSGLLDIKSKKPSPVETEFELAVNTSAANFNLSLPIKSISSASGGGILFIGRITYYEPVLWLLKQTADISGLKGLEGVHDIRTAPFIRSGAIIGNYRFNNNLELNATGFWGMDGLGVATESISHENGYDSHYKGRTDMLAYQTFLTSSLYWNPHNDMLLKFTVGTGYQSSEIDVDNRESIIDKDFLQTAENIGYYDKLSSRFNNPYNFNVVQILKETNNIFNTQGRVDYDWELGNGFLFSAGVQEMFAGINTESYQQGYLEKQFRDISPDEQEKILNLNNINSSDPLNNFFQESVMVRFPTIISISAENKMFISSGYSLLEYTTPNQRFSTEFGLRIDHYYLSDKDFNLSSKPILNPRLNIDFNLFKNKRLIQSFVLSAGTGIFSSTNINIFNMAGINSIDEYKPDRSWTSVLGAKIDFSGGLRSNIEIYYKYIYDRMYVPIKYTLDIVDMQPQFDGEGKVWGIDLMLQKTQSRFFDGWISYSFNWAQYRDPNSDNGNEWYYPLYHRFHNLNLVLNVKPTPRFNIYTRLGLASGTLLEKLIGNAPESYPVYMYDHDNPENCQFIEKYFWLSEKDETKRLPPSLQMDIKFSVFGKKNIGKSRYEVYVAVENILGLLYTPQGNPSYNPYTGEVTTNNISMSSMPIPIPSFGFIYSY
jgi:hypothetical protein